MQNEFSQIHTFTGVVVEIGELKLNESKFGLLPYENRKIKLETREKFPQSAWFTVRERLCSLPCAIGDTVVVNYNLRAFTTTQGAQGTALNAWQIRVLERKNFDQK